MHARAGCDVGGRDDFVACRKPGEHLDLLRRGDAFFGTMLAKVPGLVPPEHLAVARLMLINMDPPSHTRYRRLISRSFAARVIDRLEPQIRELCRSVIDGLVAERCVDSQVAGEQPAHEHVLEARRVGEAQALARAGVRRLVAAGGETSGACVQALEAAGRPPTRIVPEFAPEGPLAVHAVGPPATAAHMRTEGGRPWT